MCKMKHKSDTSGKDLHLSAQLMTSREKVYKSLFQLLLIRLLRTWSSARFVIPTGSSLQLIAFT